MVVDGYCQGSIVGGEVPGDPRIFEALEGVGVGMAVGIVTAAGDDGGSGIGGGKEVGTCGIARAVMGHFQDIYFGASSSLQFL